MAATVEDILVKEAVTVPIDSVSSFPNNPRVGNIEAIRESLRENGQFRPLIVQTSTGFILGGNHTWQAAKAEGWQNISVSYVDVDDDAAKRIVLADNRTNDLASYNTDLLAEVIKGLDSPAGTGYSQEDYDALLEAVATDTPLPPLNKPNILPTMTTDEGPDLDTPLGQEDDILANEADRTDEDQEAEEKPLTLPDHLKEADEQIPGAFGLKAEVQFEMVGKWHIPPLRTDMLMQPDEVPANLKAWAGSATKDWPDPDQWWLYNFGVDSTSGMHDVSKSIVSFYCWDHYFENWWNYPDRWTAKMLNSGVKYAVMPDFSLWSDLPRVMSLWNTYRNFWLARYFQEAGIKVIPNTSWPFKDRPFFDEIIRPALPKEMPVIAIQLQTFDKDMTDEERDWLAKMVEHVVTSCDPDLAIFYCGRQAEALLDELNLPVKQMRIANRMEALAAQAKTRAKKETL